MTTSTNPQSGQSQITMDEVREALNREQQRKEQAKLDAWNTGTATPTSPEPATRKKLVHCHFCPEHLLFPKSSMKKFMLDKCTQQFVCPGHLHLVNPRKIVKPLDRSAAAQTQLF